MSGLDAAAAMAKMEDSCSRWDYSPGDSVGNAMGEVGDAPPLQFSVPSFTNSVPPDEAWTGARYWVVGGRGIDSSEVGWLEQVSLVLMFT